MISAPSPLCLPGSTRFLARMIPNSATLLAAGVFLTMATCLPAATYYLGGNDTTVPTGFTSVGKWTGATSGPSSGNDYVVNGGWALGVPTDNGNYTFQGDSLLLDAPKSGAINQLAMRGSGTIAIADLRLNGGTVMSWAGTAGPQLAGGITLLEQGGVFQTSLNNKYLRVNSAITGEGMLTTITEAGNNLTIAGTMGANTWTGGTHVTGTGNLIVYTSLGMGNVTMDSGSTLTLTNGNSIFSDASLILTLETGKTTTINLSGEFDGIISSFIVNGVTYTNTSLQELASQYQNQGLVVSGPGTLSSIPEPATTVLMTTALLFFGGLAYRRRLFCRQWS